MPRARQSRVLPTYNPSRNALVGVNSRCSGGDVPDVRRRARAARARVRLDRGVDRSAVGAAGADSALSAHQRSVLKPRHMGRGCVRIARQSVQLAPTRCRDSGQSNAQERERRRFGYQRDKRRAIGCAIGWREEIARDHAKKSNCVSLPIKAVGNEIWTVVPAWMMGATPMARLVTVLTTSMSPGWKSSLPRSKQTRRRAQRTDPGR